MSVDARRSTPRRLTLALAVVMLALMLTSCSTDPSQSPSQGPSQGGERSVTDELRLGLTEWSIETGNVELLPGEVQVRVTNTGGTTHDVVIHGESGSWASPVLAPGEIHEMSITTVPGEELHLVCTLTGHESQGMHATIAVVEGA